MEQRNPEGKNSLGSIHVIGVNPSGVADLPESIQQLILSSNKICLSKRILSIFLKWWKATSKKDGLPEICISNETKEVIHWIKEQSEQIIFLASGDPLWFGIGRTLLEELPKDRLIFYPNTSSLQLAFARLGRPWQDASWISLHGRDSSPFQKLIQQRPEAIAVLTDSKNGSVHTVRQFLRSLQLEKTYQFWILQQLGHPEENIQRLLPNQEIPKDIHPLNLIVLLKEKEVSISQTNIPLFGIEDELFLQNKDRPGLITKREIRVQVLADLELPKKGVLWDLGAGVGSIGIEALRISPNLKLLSVENRLGGKRLIKANAERFSVDPTSIMECDISEILEDKRLPSSLSNPDRVILGGGGAKRILFIKKILAKLNPKGIIVVPLVTLEGLEETKKVLENKNYIFKISQHQSYRGVPLSNGTRFAPMNPVFILKAKSNQM